MKKILILSLLAFLILLQIAKADITTDKDTYKPGETVNIQLSYTEPLTDVRFDVINPNGKIEASQLSMLNKSQDIWEYNYTLKKNADNGTYLINITASQGGSIVNASTPKFYFSKNFDIIAWKVDVTLNKYHFVPLDTLSLTLLITDKYSDSLTFDVSYIFQDPLGNTVRNESLNLKSVNQGFADNYGIPEDYASGTYTIYINLIDSDRRNSSFYLNFSVSPSSLSITPNTINGTIREITDMTINFENLGDSDVNVNEIIVPENLINLISIVQRPYIISPNEQSILILRIDPSNSAPGDYNGVINVSSDNGAAQIYVNLLIPPVDTDENNEDYSFIIWTFAVFIIVVIVFITVSRYNKIRKRKKEEKRKIEAEKRKEEAFKPSQEEYRTEYY